MGLVSLIMGCISQNALTGDGVDMSEPFPHEYKKYPDGFVSLEAYRSSSTGSSECLRVWYSSPPVPSPLSDTCSVTVGLHVALYGKSPMGSLLPVDSFPREY